MQVQFVFYGELKWLHVVASMISQETTYLSHNDTFTLTLNNKGGFLEWHISAPRGNGDIQRPTKDQSPSLNQIIPCPEIH